MIQTYLKSDIITSDQSNRIGDYKGSETYKQKIAIVMKPGLDGFIKHNGYVSEHATKELRLR